MIIPLKSCWDEHNENNWVKFKKKLNAANNTWEEVLFVFRCGVRAFKKTKPFHKIPEPLKYI